jgi:3-isopropylmalate/(R)-2-methylmalate dehydratase small subunit
MEPFRSFTSVAAAMPAPDIDTDQIFPARFLKKTRKQGLGQFLFNDLRYDEDGSERAGFVLNQPRYRQARILVAERNFGCGSSREQAVYTLFDFGIRSVIAPSFGDIFFNNCFKNGLLPIPLAPAAVATLLALIRNMPGIEFRIDLEGQNVSAPDGPRYRFEINPLRKQSLLQGMDEIDFTLGYSGPIDRFEREQEAGTDWLR